MNNNKIHWSCPFWDVVERTTKDDKPYYVAFRPIRDTVHVIALTRAGKMLLIRQYRPALEAFTLEMPAGLVDEGEQPIEAALRELREETGYKPFEDTAQLIKFPMSISPGLTNELAHVVYVICEPDGQPEEGITVQEMGPGEMEGIVATALADNDIIDIKLWAGVHLANIMLDYIVQKADTILNTQGETGHA